MEQLEDCSVASAVSNGSCPSMSNLLKETLILFSKPQQAEAQMEGAMEKLEGLRADMSTVRKNPSSVSFSGRWRRSWRAQWSSWRDCGRTWTRRRSCHAVSRRCAPRSPARCPHGFLVAQASIEGSTFESTIWTAAPAAHGAPCQDASCSPGAGLARFFMRQNAMPRICRRPGPCRTMNAATLARTPAAAAPGPTVARQAVT